MSALHLRSDVDLPRDDERVVDLDSELPDGPVRDVGVRAFVPFPGDRR